MTCSTGCLRPYGVLDRRVQLWFWSTFTGGLSPDSYDRKMRASLSARKARPRRSMRRGLSLTGWRIGRGRNEVKATAVEPPGGGPQTTALRKYARRRFLCGSSSRSDRAESSAFFETTDVENYNGILRERLSRLVRKTKCFGKKKSRLENALHLFQFYWNFMKPIKENLTPAIMEGQATKIWTWGNFLHTKLRYIN